AAYSGDGNVGGSVSDAVTLVAKAPVLRLSSRNSRVKNNVAPFTFSCQNSACTVTASLTVRRGRRAVVIAAAKVSIEKGHSAKIQLRATSKGRSVLAHVSAKHKLSAVLKTTVRHGATTLTTVRLS